MSKSQELFSRTSSLHARKYAKCNNLDWVPDRYHLVPRENDITNDNLEEFVVACWYSGKDGTKSKPNVTQGRRYLNHILAYYGYPALNRNHRADYGPVLDVMKGLEKEPEWLNHQSEGAEPLTKDQVKKILMAEVHDENGELLYDRLANKAVAVSMILNGWHTKDAHDVMESNVVQEKDFVDRDGKHRPKFLFKDLSHNKRPTWKVHNAIGCGCKGSHHPKNVACPYNVLDWYQAVKAKFDDRLLHRTRRLSKPERLKHFDEDGNLKEINFFRTYYNSGTETTCNRPGSDDADSSTEI